MDPAKPPFADDETNRADDTPMRLAFREMRDFILRSRFWLILGGASVTAALAGPFYTLENLSFPARLVYWSLTAISSGILMTYLSMLGRIVAQQRGIHWLPASMVAGALGVVPIMAVVYSANRISGLDPGPYEFWSLFPFVSVPVILITVLVNGILFDPEQRRLSRIPTGTDPARAAMPAADLVTQGAEAPVASLLFSKLPHRLGREIVALQAKDHYIEVTTTQGSAMILMRLSDAEQDLSDWDGMRVHRSWWVSLPHVERIEKGTSGPELRLITGQSVPVSRGQRATLRAALAERDQAPHQ